VARPAPPVPGAVPTNPFASNYPSRAPTRGEVAAASPPSLREPGPAPSANAQGPNPHGLNPDRVGPAGPAARRPEPHRAAKLAPPKTNAAPAVKPAEAAPKPAPPAASAASAAPAAPAVAEAPKAPPPARDAAEPQRLVRVIGGITPVPGAADKPETKAAGE
jgi:hypothetical protein